MGRDAEIVLRSPDVQLLNNLPADLFLNLISQRRDSGRDVGSPPDGRPYEAGSPRQITVWHKAFSENGLQGL